MPRYRLRTLLIVLAIGPPLIWVAYYRWTILTRPTPQPALRQIIHTARFIGNRRFSDRTLTRALNLRLGEPTFLNPSWSEAARLKIAAIYHQAGYREVDVRILEGGKFGDTKAIFQIEEGIQAD